MTAADGLTVLLVEDEKPVRKLVAKILSGAGYEVLEANHGEAALSLSESYAGAIHLLVTDVMMPVMNGRELAARLAALRPGLGILFISGYPGKHFPDGFDGHGSMELLEKPFTAEALLAKVNRLARNGA